MAACLSVAVASPAAAQSIDAGAPVAAIAADAGASDATTAFGPWTREGLPPVPPRAPFALPDDDSLRFIIDNGQGGWVFLDCTSESPGEPAIEDVPALPVGGGRTLACTTPKSPLVSEGMLQGEDGRLYCWKGAATRYRTISDARLQVSVTQTPAHGPWSLRATAEQPFVMQRVGVALGEAWPLWLEVSYQTVDFAPAVDFRCDGVF